MGKKVMQCRQQCNNFITEHDERKHNKKERISCRVVMPFYRLEKEMGQRLG